jgi:hypothetical protein
MQSVPITTNVVHSNLTHGEMYSMQLYVINFVRTLLVAGRWVSPGTLVSSTNQNLPARYNWYIVESGVKHHYPLFESSRSWHLVPVESNQRLQNCYLLLIHYKHTTVWTKTGWIRILKIYTSGATFLAIYCCFSEQGLKKFGYHNQLINMYFPVGKLECIIE